MSLLPASRSSRPPHDSGSTTPQSSGTPAQSHLSGEPGADTHDTPPQLPLAPNTHVRSAYRQGATVAGQKRPWTDIDNSETRDIRGFAGQAEDRLDNSETASGGTPPNGLPASFPVDPTPYLGRTENQYHDGLPGPTRLASTSFQPAASNGHHDPLSASTVQTLLERLPTTIGSSTPLPSSVAIVSSGERPDNGRTPSRVSGTTPVPDTPIQACPDQQRSTPDQRISQASSTDGGLIVY